MINIDELSSYVIALSSVHGIGPKTIVRIVDTFPSAESLSSATYETLAQELGSDKFATTLTAELRGGWGRRLSNARATVARHREAGISVVAINDVAYPPLLKMIADPPAALFVRGSVAALCSPSAVAVVGTRNPTDNGTKIAARIAGTLANSGFAIVSGLAKGIDTHAHRGCLSNGGITVAVLANPVDAASVYPAENRRLADEIADLHGALVSETPLGVQVHRSSFVQRDRIQSGLSIAVFAIQTDVEGGTMHTVRFAERDNRLVFCPKPIESEASESAWAGVTHLLKTHRAQEFDKSCYDQVLSKLREYEAVLRRDKGTPHTDARPKDGKASETTPSLFPPSLEPAPEPPPVHEPPLVNDEKWLSAVEAIFREQQIDKAKFNSLVTMLRKRLFSAPKSKRKAPPKSIKRTDSSGDTNE
jgi:DNA processing protein